MWAKVSEYNSAPLLLVMDIKGTTDELIALSENLASLMRWEGEKLTPLDLQRLRVTLHGLDIEAVILLIHMREPKDRSDN